MVADYPTWTVLSGMDAKFESWELGIPAELRPGTTQEQDIILFAGISQPEIQRFTRQRYMITTWYHLIRLKLYTLVLKQYQPPPLTMARPESPDHVQHYAEKCIRSALELMKFQCDTFDRMRRTQFGERWVGGNWYFEGCLSLFEAAVALLLALTKFPTTFLVPPGANMVEETKKGLRLEYEEMTRAISRVVDVFSEVVTSEREPENGVVKEGKRAELAAKALEALRMLLREHWWKLDPRTEVGKSPLMVGSGPYVDGAFSTSQNSASPSGSGSSPQRVGSSPGMNIAGAGAAYSGPRHPGSMFSPHQGPVPSTGQGQQPGSIQSYSSLVSPIEATSTTPLMQQQMNYQAYPSAYYANAPQFSAAVKAQIPPFAQQSVSGSSLPVTTATTSYPSCSQNIMGEVATLTPAGPRTHSQYHYISQSQNYSDYSSFSNMDGTAYATQFSFTPLQSQTQTQGHYQNPAPQRFQSAPQPSLQNTTEHPSSTSNNPATNAYGYSLAPPGDTMRPLSGILPTSQAMRMIHYVAPGLKTPSSAASTTPTAVNQANSGGATEQESVMLEPSATEPRTVVLNEFVPPELTVVPEGGTGARGAPGIYYEQ